MGIPCLPCSKQKKIKANQKSKSQLPDQSSSNLGTPPIDNNQDNETYLKENDKILNDKKNEIINRERIVNKREEILFKKEKDITEKENELNKKMEEFIKKEKPIIEKEEREKIKKNHRERTEKEERERLEMEEGERERERKEKEEREREERKRKEREREKKEKPKINSQSKSDEELEFEIIERKRKEEMQNSKEFYDMILNFSNFEQLKQNGWEISWGDNEAKKKYNNCLEKNNVIIGVLGNKNRGKSFLLGKIIKKENYFNKSGYLITTIGISANFPVLDDKDKTYIITLDTAGKDNPLLESSNLFNNSDSQIEKEKDERIKNKARDQRVSEIVLSDFIIDKSDVLITVIEQLSFAEQDMLKNLINQLKAKSNNRDYPQILLVIHNLMNFRNIDNINYFIKNTLLNSLTFDLRNNEQPMTNFKDEEENVDDRDKYVYVQKTEEQDKLEIFHIIMGNYYIQDIKEYFNEPAVRFIRKVIRTSNSKIFDLIGEFKKFIINNSKTYLNGVGFDEESLTIKRKGSNSQGMPEAIILKEPKEFNLKGVIVDSKGMHNFLAAIEPNYSSNIFKEKNGKDYYLLITFEMFGEIVGDNDGININISIINYQHVISINGKVKDINDINDNTTDIKGNLKYSEFFFQIIIDIFFDIRDNKKNIEAGEYNLAEIMNDKKCIISDTDCGVYKIKFPIKFIKMD